MPLILRPEKWQRRPVGALELSPEWEEYVRVAVAPDGDDRAIVLLHGAAGRVEPPGFWFASTAYTGTSKEGHSLGSLTDNASTYWTAAGQVPDVSKGVSLLGRAALFSHGVNTIRTIAALDRSTGTDTRIGPSHRTSGTFSATAVYGSAVRYLDSSDNYELGTFYTVAGRFPQSVVDDCPHLYVNGRKDPGTVTSSVGTGSLQTNVTQYTFFGPGLNGQGILGVVLDLLPDAALLELTRNPWQLFRARRVLVPMNAAGVSIPTLGFPGVQAITTTSAQPKVSLTY